MRFLAPPDLPSLAIADGATTPVPTAGAGGLAWSTTETAVVAFNGTSWAKLASGSTIHSARLDTAVSQSVPSTSLSDTLTVSTPLVTKSIIDGQGDTTVEVVGQHNFAGVRFSGTAGNATIIGSRSIAYVAGDNSSVGDFITIGLQGTATRNSATDIMSTAGDATFLIGARVSAEHGPTLNSAAVTTIMRSIQGRATQQAGQVDDMAVYSSEVFIEAAGASNVIATLVTSLNTTAQVNKAGAGSATVATYVDLYLGGIFATGGASITQRYGIWQIASDHLNLFQGLTLFIQPIVQLQYSPISKSASATLTIADLLNRLITSTATSAATFTLPTGTNCEFNTGTGVAVDTDWSFEWSVVNTGTVPVALAGNTGHTIVGGASVPVGTSTLFRTRKVATNTFVTYVVAGDDASASGGATTGTATINFGASPGANEASVTFSSATIGAGSTAQAFIMAGDTSSNHTAADHRYAAALIGLSVSVTAGVGGTIYARSPHKLTGQFTVRWQWN